ncbi:hypothetical protein [Sporolactobacillus sp. KGMB 08714]|uniref:hypothetical protein n=1 Tax=Sporolactobacillus sp. KGMB 08714 TaxID=3064704 RepID=UPI002FBE1EB3
MPIVPKVPSNEQLQARAPFLCDDAFSQPAAGGYELASGFYELCSTELKSGQPAGRFMMTAHA